MTPTAATPAVAAQGSLEKPSSLVTLTFVEPQQRLKVGWRNMLMRVKKWSKKGERKRKDSRRADAQCARGRIA
ncbi:uncharacterized protein G2W53_016976 [Senna tora]|uniref:Uncharacterized protein n=1 Tax=Senna tora TaxID=362788 RepID=A0A834TQ25_9FABA|nr:uncharacterized protein G2W53_016976 [Senna tora]